MPGQALMREAGIVLKPGFDLRVISRGNVSTGLPVCSPSAISLRIPWEKRPTYGVQIQPIGERFVVTIPALRMCRRKNAG
jgi:hypothetical protein